MELLATLGECACKELGYYTGATSATLRRLEKLELLTLREQEILPPPPPAAAADPKPLLLTPQQQAAYDSLSARLQDASPGTALLYGVTGSGKTVVYLRLIDRLPCRRARRDRPCAGDRPDAAAPARSFPHATARASPCSTAPCASASAMRRGSASAPAMPTWCSALARPCSRRCGTSVCSLWTRSRSTPTNPKMHRATMPARSRSTAARRSMR